MCTCMWMEWDGMGLYINYGICINKIYMDCLSHLLCVYRVEFRDRVLDSGAKPRPECMLLHISLFGEPIIIILSH